MKEYTQHSGVSELRHTYLVIMKDCVSENTCMDLRHMPVQDMRSEAPKQLDGLGA